MVTKNALSVRTGRFLRRGDICKKRGPPAAFSATRKEEKKMKKDDLFIYMIIGRCEEKKWSNIKFL